MCKSGDRFSCKIKQKKKKRNTFYEVWGISKITLRLVLFELLSTKKIRVR